MNCKIFSTNTTKSIIVAVKALGVLRLLLELFIELKDLLTVLSAHEPHLDRGVVLTCPD